MWRGRWRTCGKYIHDDAATRATAGTIFYLAHRTGWEGSRAAQTLSKDGARAAKKEAEDGGGEPAEWQAGRNQDLDYEQTLERYGGRIRIRDSGETGASLMVRSDSGVWLPVGKLGDMGRSALVALIESARRYYGTQDVLPVSARHF